MLLGRKPKQQSIKAGNSSTNIQTGNSSPVTISTSSQTITGLTHTTEPIEIDKSGGVENPRVRSTHLTLEIELG